MIASRTVVEALLECISLPTPTPPGEVALVADWIEGWAKSFGAEVVRQEVEPGKDNVLVTLDFGTGPRLVFNTHMDVNNPQGQTWTHSPYTPVVENGKIFGLGACDAKGSLVSMLCAMERISAKREGLKGKLTLTAVMGEEAGGIGSLFLVNQGIQADGAVVGEPTQLEVAIAHKGTYMRRLRFQGKSAHSGSPHLGNNAIHHAAAFCAEYEQLGHELAKAPHPQLGPANAAVTIFQGGTRQNTIPGSAEIIIDRRLIPGETHEKADRELQLMIERLQERRSGFHLESVEVVVATIPSETKATERIVDVALEAAGEVTGIKKEAKGFSAGCDMSKLVTIAGIPTVILGPGSLAQAHAPDEFVEITQLEQAVGIYEQIARRFLGE